MNSKYKDITDFHCAMLEEVRATGTDMQDAQAVADKLDELELWETWTYLTDEEGNVDEARYEELHKLMGS